MPMASKKQSIKADIHRSRNLFLGGTALALILFCPLPERVFPAEVQEIFRKQNRLPDNQYGELWQKERRRLDQLNTSKDDAASTSNPGEVLSDSKTQQQAIFIPITWLKERKPEYYSASDPEWHEFERLSEDAQRRTAVKTRLCEQVCETLRSQQSVTRKIGKPLTVHINWLDFKFPLMAPIGYERSGILWTNGQIKWTTRQVGEQQVNRVYRVLVPTALFSSLQVLSSTLLKSHYESLKRLWLRSDNPERPGDGDKPITQPLSRATGEGEHPNIAAEKIQNRSSTSQQNMTSATTPDLQAGLIRSILPESEPNSSISAAMQAFKSMFVQKWHTPHVILPRGSCILKGQIGIKGPNGRCKVSVISVYLPKEDLFLRVVATDVDIFPRRQAPLGRRNLEKVSKSDNDPKS